MANLMAHADKRVWNKIMEYSEIYPITTMRVYDDLCKNSITLDLKLDTALFLTYHVLNETTISHSKILNLFNNGREI